MQDHVPAPLKGAYRVTLELADAKRRLDAVLLEALRNQSAQLTLKNISRGAFKALFDQNRIKIKGQNAKPASALNKGTTYVDILGFGEEEPASS